MKSLNVITHVKAAEQYFPVVLLIVLHKVILLNVWTKIVLCDHSNESRY